jgi:hypothetical protein
MAAIGSLVELLVWCLAWSVGATCLALSRFDEPDARFAGLPGRTWAALVVAWLWPVLLAASFWMNGMLWAVVAVAPMGTMLVLLEVLVTARGRRSPV